MARYVIYAEPCEMRMLKEALEDKIVACENEIYKYKDCTVNQVFTGSVGVILKNVVRYENLYSKINEAMNRKGV